MLLPFLAFTQIWEVWQLARLSSSRVLYLNLSDTFYLIGIHVLPAYVCVKLSESLELELQAVMGCHVVIGN